MVRRLKRQPRAEKEANMSCKCAKSTDEYHGWECEITGGECMFLFPDSKACAREYGEGPDAEEYQEEDDVESDECSCPLCKAECENAGYNMGTCPNCEGQAIYGCERYK